MVPSRSSFLGLAVDLALRAAHSQAVRRLFPGLLSAELEMIYLRGALSERVLEPRLKTQSRTKALRASLQS